MDDNLFDSDNLSYLNINEEAEFIPLSANEDEDSIPNSDIPEEIPVLPLRNTVLFPGVVIPITVGREKSIKLIKEAYKSNKIIGVTAQKDGSIEEPIDLDLNTTGTIALILKMLKMPDGSTTVIIQGKKRFNVRQFTAFEPYFKANVELFSEEKNVENDPEFEALVSNIRDISIQIINQSPHMPQEATMAIKNIESPSYLINFVSSNLNIDVLEKQLILEEISLKERALLVLTYLQQELELSNLKHQIQTKVKVNLDKQQRDYFLQQQIKTIQDELGNGEGQEIKELKERAAKKKWSDKVRAVFDKEVLKLERINPMQAEYSVFLNYLEFMIDLPWEKYSKDRFDLKKAQKILDRDHSGLEKVKDRIIEHLAVLKLKGDMKSPILCLVGPPGVGKTSLGKSIAEALGREYVRMSLGGLRDEAEIRGHRKTYIGAMAGRVLQNIKKAGTSNPVFILDEIDKLGNDFHGDPSSALLEVLDPEQNGAFHDNYLDIDYDLSNVLFIATANSLSTIQPALRDRMEIIQLSGYATEEKIDIAQKHLLPKQLKEAGLGEKSLMVSAKVLEKVIEDYTRESGVRNLDRKVAKLARYAAKEKVLNDKDVKTITIEDLPTVLGPAHPKEKYENNDFAGVVTGLAWTSVGGDILFIESSLSPGKGKLTITGNLGNVMKESSLIAMEYLRARAKKYGIADEVFDQWNLHIHVPEGATPKDGPSAGITMLTSIASVFTQRKVRAKLAMTGEITLRGQVLAVGGIKEKILAAKRAGIKEVILSKDNEKDILEIEARYIKGLSFHYVETAEEVLNIALLKEKVKNALDISPKKEVKKRN